MSTVKERKRDREKKKRTRTRKNIENNIHSQKSKNIKLIFDAVTLQT